MPFAEMQRQPDELSSIMLFVDAQRDALLAKLDGLTFEQATSTPTVSALSVFTIVKHCANVERRWVQAAIGGVPGLWPAPPGTRDKEFRAEPDDSIESLRAFYAEVVAANRSVIEGIADLGAELPAGVDARWVLLHLVEELARHAGQADIVREAIDGAVERD